MASEKRHRSSSRSGERHRRHGDSRRRDASRSPERTVNNRKRRRDTSHQHHAKSEHRIFEPTDSRVHVRRPSSHGSRSRKIDDVHDDRRRNNIEDTGEADQDCTEEPLPVTLFKDELMKAIHSSQVLVCTGETGSGKTTQIPQYLLGLIYQISHGSQSTNENEVTKRSSRQLQVAVTQPRRVAAISVARRVAEERGSRLGDEVGYSIRFEDRTSDRTRIKYMTDGVLVRECLEDHLLSRYGIVMLDEAHERSIDTDILFGLLKRALAKRKDLRAVITSATLDVERFAAFFGGCPYIHIPGRTHAVDVYHSKTRQVMTATGPSSKTYVEDAVSVILKVHRTQEAGHILAFFTGQDEIEKATRLLSEAVHEDRTHEGEASAQVESPGRPTELQIIPLFGALSADAQAQAFRPARRGVRKVIAATNIAETSVTVPGIRFVVDPGYVKQKTYDPARRMESLIVVPISQVAAQQRAGRAGRTSPGQCYRLYSRDCFANMVDETVPEILRTNLANTLLYLKVLGINDVLSFEFLDPPAEDQALEALQHLYCLGALSEDGRVTEIGHRMSRYPLDPSLSRTLLEASELACLEEVLTIVALLSVESIWFSRTRGRGEENKGERDDEADASHARFRHPLGDHFTYLQAYNAWEANGCSDEWAKGAFLRVRALRTAKSVRAQLVGELRKSHGTRSGGASHRGVSMKPMSCGRDLDKVRKAVCAGYFMNAGQRCSKEWVYRSLAVEALQAEGKQTGQTGLTLMYLHLTSALTHEHEPPEHIIFTELVFTVRPFMRHAMVVKGKWLRNKLSAVRPCSADRLCGREVSTQSGDNGAGKALTMDGALGEATLARTKNADERQESKKDAVAAARERFLARKRAR